MDGPSSQESLFGAYRLCNLVQVNSVDIGPGTIFYVTSALCYC
jgi:hypothetical protein